MNTDQPSFDELIALARDRADGVISHLAAAGYVSRSQAVAVQTRWSGAIHGTAAVVAQLMPEPRYAGLRARGPAALDPVSAAALRYAMAMRTVSIETGGRPGLERVTLSPLEDDVEAARRAIGAAHDIVSGRHIPADDAHRLMALTAPLTHVLAQSRRVLGGALGTFRSARISVPNLAFAADAASTLAALFADGSASAVGRALALPSRAIRTDSPGHEWIDHCAAIAGYVHDQRVRDVMVSVRVAMLVARAQLITCTVQGDTSSIGQWLAVTQGLSGRSSVLGLDAELAAHHFRLHQIAQSLPASGPEYAALVDAMPTARTHLNSATSDLGHIVARDHIDQWLPGKTQRRYLPKLASPTFLPQRTNAALPPLPMTSVGALNCPQL